MNSTDTTYPDELRPYIDAWDLERGWQFSYIHPSQAQTFPSLSAVRSALRSAGSHYFDRDTLRFFRARTHGDVSGGRFWVESIQDDDAPRQYRVSWVSKYVRADFREALSVQHSADVATLEEARSVRALFVKHYAG